MSIEKDIGQKAFRNPYHKLIVNLHYSSSWLLNNHSRLLKPFDLTVPQFNVLQILKSNHPEPSSINYIIERMLDKMSNATRLVDKLCAKGLVSKTNSARDKRAVDVILTEKGLEILEELDHIHEKIESFASNLMENETLIINNLLEKIQTQNSSSKE
ncbi:DNA-binding transcriptional regulator, MarR family [Pseudarcicella hirudinis]|uniref:DNA-binding transcriptional regulator, MarR family n=1 Tax=Pseudarcicella hirudinis TaxID=1079859 RepID=A0A1I5PHF9_9BACT|nr:MarR family transcriptional regulator [Pseudarcicella hirudinis]SFP33475.1 DNA-binding transcriptional regulator, MarR family [Pseudarcicella hirudinis]